MPIIDDEKPDEKDAPSWSGRRHYPHDLLRTDEKWCVVYLHNDMVGHHVTQHTPNTTCCRLDCNLPANHTLQGWIQVRIDET
jgi:hypothetical protein